ncbi:hypothetical protein AVEN_30570-1 [Araneus ventricosus]|uniref:ribonuclease H n=1 Tax=Araneus ventricosus TaxID=182803 RepID=A0A4Y2ENE9_ARAVE|nr:hypothetical protein AVEN_30570-1 [Araneus ventricosus]
MRQTRATWGVRPPIVKELHLKAIQSFILYGVETWYSDLVKLNSKLTQIQRIPLQVIAKNYRTVSTDVLTGCPPLDLVARAKSLKYDLIYRDKQITLNDMILFRDQFDLPYKQFHPPWLLISIPRSLDLDPNKSVPKIFTDGSKLNERVGRGIVCYDENNKESWSSLYRLSDNTSVFIAEATAILFAIKKVCHLTQEIIILTDSRSVLMALEAIKDQTTLINDIQDSLRDHPNILMGWVKAHVGIGGNERADSLEKEATTRSQIDINVKYSKTWLKNSLNKFIVNNWQLRWENSRNARYTFGLFPEVSLDRCYGDFFLNQFLTGHGVFSIHQSKFYGKSDQCNCGLDKGTITHYLFGCPNFGHIRREFFPNNF